MGQRLNIEIIESGKTLANAYYHWSGYSNSSIEIAKGIIDKIESIQEENSLLKAIRLLESTGAGLQEGEEELVKSNPDLANVTFKAATSRNNGLIAVSEKGINETRYWQEGAIYIYLDENRLSYKVFSTQSFWEFKRDFEEDKHCEIQLGDIEVADINFDDVKFADIDKFVEFINGHLESQFVTVYDPITVVQMIY